MADVFYRHIPRIQSDIIHWLRSLTSLHLAQICVNRTNTPIPYSQIIRYLSLDISNNLTIFTYVRIDSY